MSSIFLFLQVLKVNLCLWPLVDIGESFLLQVYKPVWAHQNYFLCWLPLFVDENLPSDLQVLAYALTWVTLSWAYYQTAYLEETESF